MELFPACQPAMQLPAPLLGCNWREAELELLLQEGAAPHASKSHSYSREVAEENYCHLLFQPEPMTAFKQSRQAPDRRQSSLEGWELPKEEASSLYLNVSSLGKAEIGQTMGREGEGDLFRFLMSPSPPLLCLICLSSLLSHRLSIHCLPVVLWTPQVCFFRWPSLLYGFSGASPKHSSVGIFSRTPGSGTAAPQCEFSDV